MKGSELRIPHSVFRSQEKCINNGNYEVTIQTPCFCISCFSLSKQCHVHYIICSSKGYCYMILKDERSIDEWVDLRIKCKNDVGMVWQNDDEEEFKLWNEGKKCFKCFASMKVMVLSQSVSVCAFLRSIQNKWACKRWGQELAEAEAQRCGFREKRIIMQISTTPVYMTSGKKFITDVCLPSTLCTTRPNAKAWCEGFFVDKECKTARHTDDKNWRWEKTR